MTMTTAAKAITDAPTRTATEASGSFTPPGPGTWMLDAPHCERPRTAYMNAMFEALYTAGFRMGFARYGALLDTIEYKPIRSYPYTSVRPLGAPPDAKGLPPRWIFKLLLKLHPALRKRCKQAAVAMNTRIWREDIAAFWRDLPAEEKGLVALGAVDVQSLDDDSLLAHVERMHAVAEKRILEHFQYAPAAMVAVGDFVAHVRDWTGAEGRDVLAALRGSSPASVGGTRALETVANAIAANADARARLESTEPAANVIAALRSMPGAVGETMESLFVRYGDVILSGHDLSEASLAEMPELAVATLRARIAAPTQSDDARAAADQAANELRNRVPEEHRALFDEMLGDARAAYPLRDARGGVDFWALGTLRRALLEVGRRMASRSRIARADDVFDFAPDELFAALRGTTTPSAEDVASRARWRRTGRLADAPMIVGPEPGKPPPPEWLPASAGRAARAVGTYLDLIWTEGQGAKDRDATIRGLGASPGRRTGRARVVRSAADFGKLAQGDILVAPITTPAYNVILPLLGGVVTDRGGLLSHPAIVSREYGFPGVVGARDATARISDGALVEIDGDAGTVKVLE